MASPAYRAQGLMVEGGRDDAETDPLPTVGGIDLDPLDCHLRTGDGDVRMAQIPPAGIDGNDAPIRLPVVPTVGGDPVACHAAGADATRRNGRWIPNDDRRRPGGDRGR
jgi:hypothetical protein